MLLGFLPLARSPGEPAEAEVAVGQERAHAELFPQGASFSVIPLSLLDVRAIPMRDDVPEKAERPALVPPLAVLPRNRQRASGAFERLASAMRGLAQQPTGAGAPRPRMAFMSATLYALYALLLDRA